MISTLQSLRVVTFVPADKAKAFAADIAADIPHLFGDYDSVCWWSAPLQEAGTEQFRARPDGTLQAEPSVRMEFSIPADPAAQEAFTARLRALHPWKEPVILIFEAKILSHD